MVKILNRKFSKKLYLRLEVIRDFSFSKNTTYGLGAQIKCMFKPSNILQLILAFELLNNKNKKYILGNGSNLLVSEKFDSDFAIWTKGYKGVYKIANDKIFCRCGTMVSEVLKFCLDNNLGGLEYLAGIPGTIGGVCYMNGGAGGIYIENNVVDIYLYTNKINKINNEKCKYTYKHSTMQDINTLILGVILKVFPCNTNESRYKVKYFIDNRNKLPKGKSCGCVFKNPVGISAGKLIEECGLKGKRIGGAEISTVHGNFIINNNGTSKDVANLIDFIKKEVYNKRGILLVEEVNFWGVFNETYG